MLRPLLNVWSRPLPCKSGISLIARASPPLTPQAAFAIARGLGGEGGRAVSDDWSPRTKLVHGGARRSQYGETSEAIYLTQGFVYPDAETAERRFISSGHGA